jgi:hypothetical protein
MTIKAVKLVSGEELIGEVLHEEPGLEVTLKNVVAVMISRTQSGDLSIGFVPFAPYLGKGASHSFELVKTIFVKEVDEQMANQYNSIFGGVVVPPKQILLG